MSYWLREKPGENETLTVEISESIGTVTATVSYTDHTDVPLIGALLPDVVLTASVTMAIEPP